MRGMEISTFYGSTGKVRFYNDDGFISFILLSFIILEGGRRGLSWDIYLCVIYIYIYIYMRGCFSELCGQLKWLYLSSLDYPFL